MSLISTPKSRQQFNEQFEAWLRTPLGLYALQWEQKQLNSVVADVFGYNAAQIGGLGLSALVENRMQCRVVLNDAENAGVVLEDGISLVLATSFDDLPIADESLDLLVLPHVLEFCADPHAMLREVDRVLRPEGKLVVTGFNPISLWGLTKPTPRQQLIGLPRLKDWLKLLSFENDVSHYGCYRPPFTDAALLERFRVLETAGDRWWPICGAVYLHCAVKKVHNMRMVGPMWKKMGVKAKVQPALVQNKRKETTRKMEFYDC
jgi:ubiquinone/menaquinone biosynthesis C-methylase UbiE